jgi:hypothetical protein
MNKFISHIAVQSKEVALWLEEEAQEYEIAVG